MNLLSNKQGQSVIEVMIAVSIFVSIAAGAVVAIIGSLSASRLAEEETISTELAYEGLEAAGSIRNRAWDNLTNGDHGLDSSGGLWRLNGSSDTIDGRYQRVVNVSSVERDVNGNILESGGTIDIDTKRVTSTVTWNFTAARTNTVELTTYLTNWQEATTTDPAYTSCYEFCASTGYTNGTCRNNPGQCSSSGEVNEPDGDKFCGSPPDNTCCCQ